MENKEVQILSDQEKVVSLFEFIKELNKLKQKITLNIKEYPWHYAISDIPFLPEYVKIFYRDRVDEENENVDEDDILLIVRKPEFEKCPVPDSLFEAWLLPHWDDYHVEADVKYENYK